MGKICEKSISKIVFNFTIDNDNGVGFAAQAAVFSMSLTNDDEKEINNIILEKK